MIFVPESVMEIEIEGAKFKIKPLSGEEILEIFGKKGFEKISTIDAETAAELLRQSVMEFEHEGKKYPKDAISKLKMHVYSQLLQKVIELNFEVDKNFPMKKE